MSVLARSKSMAKALRKALAERQVNLSHSACLEIVARQFGFPDWNVLKAAIDTEMSLTFTLFVEHGRQQEAATFYATAFGAKQTKAHPLPGAVHTEVLRLRAGELMAAELDLGGSMIVVCGANPRREAEPSRGGPFFLKKPGSGSTAVRLSVNDVAAVVKAAVAAGATIRDSLTIAEDGSRMATIFDPFGHIWGLHEKKVTVVRQAA